jgi:hypothetical protein
MTDHHQHVEALQDIRRMMQRSSRFISLSGLSGIAAGFWALLGAFFAYDWIYEYYVGYETNGYSGPAFDRLKWNLMFLAGAVLGAALLSAFYFTWRRAKGNKLPVWDHTAKMLTASVMIPLVTGGIVILSLLKYNEWRYLAPLCLIFYGLSLVSGSKYTLSEIRYLGLMEIFLGLVNFHFIGYGLYFWTAGFGVLHIIYGFIMWWKYERSGAVAIDVK